MTRSFTGLPFDDIRGLLASMPGGDEVAAAGVHARNRELAKPAGSLGRLEEIAEWLARWQGTTRPGLDRPLIAIFAGTHGLAVRAASEPSARTHRMVELFAAGGGAVNQLALAANAGLKVFDLALDLPVPDIAADEALSEQACAATMAFGMEAIAGGADLLCVAAEGEGGEVAAAALAAALFGGVAEDWTDDAGAAGIVRGALAHHGAALGDPLEALRRVGGRELAAIAGAILAARYQKIPVLLDGFIACAAAAALQKAAPAALDHCLAAHRSGTAAHDRLLRAIGKKPLLDLGISLEDGSGAALAVGIVRAAAQTHAGMATQAQAGLG